MYLEATTYSSNYQLEKWQQQMGGIEPSYHDLEANEQTTLVHHGNTYDADSLFKPLLDKELEKILRFYEAQEKELLVELAVLEQSITQQDELDLRQDSTIWMKKILKKWVGSILFA
ncbi:hypothetical protein BD769DRAFT_1716870 [Suillus cothurnatus]|nr:hypothetical protein BD769DRAFT_1716870 [Suillus cothurnatus]